MKYLYKSVFNNTLFILIIGLVPALVSAIETRIDVRVLSRGAKFIGTSMGGAEIVLRDADTGEIYARGVTAGTTGSTEIIMEQTHKRGDVVADDNAAVYSARIDLAEPRRIEVSALGPLAQRQAANKVTATQWVVPGKHLIGGNGWLLEIPGFAVDILDPPAHQFNTGLPYSLDVRANVVKMCGCPITDGGLWDANDYEVKGMVKYNGKMITEFDLNYTGEISQFAGSLQLDQPGSYDISVYAYDPHTGNTGLDRTTINLGKD
ncbi:MAG: hypothetical protein WDZ86_01900 [Gammaproteobacteria bacterium]